MYEDPIVNNYDDYQKDIIDIYMKDYDYPCKGIALIGCGGGKSWLSHEITRKSIIKRVNEIIIKSTLHPLIFGTMSHRLGLNIQHLENFIKQVLKPCAKLKIPVGIILIGSESAPMEIQMKVKKLLHYATGKSVNVSIENTTSLSNFQDILRIHRLNGYHTYIISTYQSHNVLVLPTGYEMEYLNLDECHNLVPSSAPEEVNREGKEYCNALHIYAKKKLFTTATSKETLEKDGIGMQNKEYWGEIICSISSAQLIKIGRIVPYKLSVISTTSEIEGIDISKVSEIKKMKDIVEVGKKEFSSKVDMITKTWEHQKFTLLEKSGFPEEIGHKMLVVSNGLGEQ